MTPGFSFSASHKKLGIYTFLVMFGIFIFRASTLQLDSLMVPAAGTEPLAFKSIYAASGGLQAKACIARAFKQVRGKNSVSGLTEAMSFSQRLGS